MYQFSLKNSNEITSSMMSSGNNPEDAQADFESRFGLDSRDGKIHVLMIGGDITGCGYYRIDLPAKYLNRQPDIVAFPTVRITPELVQWAHIMVWQRQHKDDLKSVRQIAEKTGRIQLFELDDNLHEVHPSNPAYQFYNPRTKEFSDMLEWIKSCKILTCTREQLGEYYRNRLGVPYIVLPNSLDFELIPTPKVNDTGRLRIGWMGSSTHSEDLKHIVYAITTLKQEYDFDFVMMGWDGVNRVKHNDNLIPVEDIFEGLPREFHQWCEVDKYIETVNDLKLDIGLCPVDDNIFNASKSNIKWQEYSALGVPSVVSNVSCYTDYIRHGETALVAKNEADWYKQIKRLIDDVVLRKNIAQNAKNLVHERFDMGKNVHLWASLYRNLMQHG